MSTQLFEPLLIRSTRFRNRIFVSPMCQYSAVDGVAQPWHLVHLGSRAVGGAGLVLVEATGVAPEGRITPGCLGLWNEKQADALRPITEFVRAQGAEIGIQLAHAGRKASCNIPWRGGKPLGEKEGAWEVCAPSAVPFAPGFPVPKALTAPDLDRLLQTYLHSAALAHKAGFSVLEIHMAHGYLMHEFLSPLSNHRDDEYGGPLENRMRFPLRLARELRNAWSGPLFVRISATDWMPGGWDLKQSIVFTSELQKAGVDFLDCSSGGLVADAKVPVAPGYQVPFAATIRKQTGILTGAVGMIVAPDQAEKILQKGEADAVLLARELLRDPYWPLTAARALGAEISWPAQYERAKA